MKFIKNYFNMEPRLYSGECGCNVLLELSNGKREKNRNVEAC